MNLLLALGRVEWADEGREDESCCRLSRLSSYAAQSRRPRWRAEVGSIHGHA